MLVQCTFEELSALTAGAEATLEVAALGGGVAAPPRAVADVEALLARTDGDLELDTIVELRSVERAVDSILAHLRQRVDGTILEQYVGAEDAVAAYFDFAHVLTFRERVRRAGEEMEALLELMKGVSEDPTRELPSRN
ncbi:MAG TPA: hypothetical protein VF832_19180 [Longimicrobiales bacterium]